MVVTQPEGVYLMNSSDLKGLKSPVGSYSTYISTNKFASLDGLRAFAIIGVLWHHSTIGSTFSRGFLGVDLFFVISGFLIVTLLLRERSKFGAVSLRNFYARRSLRIFPAYWAMLLFVASVAYLKPGHESDAIKHDLPFAVLYISNLAPMASLLSITWSLSTEEQFYLVVPALQKYLPRVFPMVLLPIAYVIVALPPFNVFPALRMPDFFRQTTFGPILLGVMLAHVLNHPRGWAAVALVLRSRLSPLLALTLVALTICYPGRDISGWPRLAIHASLVILLAACVVRERHALRPVLTWWPIRRIGVVSYGIYLYHLLVYWPVVKLLKLAGIESMYALFVLLTASSWLVAELSYHFFERKFLVLKMRYSPDNHADRSPLVLAGASLKS